MATSEIEKIEKRIVSSGAKLSLGPALFPKFNITGPLELLEKDQE
jgi:hypothetical protein